MVKWVKVVRKWATERQHFLTILSTLTTFTAFQKESPTRCSG